MSSSVSANVFAALSDPTRLAVVELLGSGPRRASEIADAAGTSRPTMSRHLRVLLEAGIAQDERLRDDGRARVFRLRREALDEVRRWLDELQREWDTQLASFQRHVERRQRDGSAPSRRKRS